ncbi:hypothetical protein Ntsu_78790 [Nocardia sp. IFM 10818]
MAIPAFTVTPRSPVRVGSRAHPGRRFPHPVGASGSLTAIPARAGAWFFVGLLGRGLLLGLHDSAIPWCRRMTRTARLSGWRNIPSPSPVKTQQTDSKCSVSEHENRRVLSGLPFPGTGSTPRHLAGHGQRGLPMSTTRSVPDTTAPCPCRLATPRTREHTVPAAAAAAFHPIPAAPVPGQRQISAKTEVDR